MARPKYAVTYCPHWLFNMTIYFKPTSLVLGANTQSIQILTMIAWYVKWFLEACVIKTVCKIKYYETSGGFAMEEYSYFIPRN